MKATRYQKAEAARQCSPAAICKHCRRPLREHVRLVFWCLYTESAAGWSPYAQGVGRGLPPMFEDSGELEVSHAVDTEGQPGGSRGGLPPMFEDSGELEVSHAVDTEGQPAGAGEPAGLSGLSPELLIVDDPHTQEPVTPERRAAVEDWYQKTFENLGDKHLQVFD